MNTGSDQDWLLAEQRAYYSVLAPDYLDQVRDLPGGAELTDALDAFRPAGSVLDLACGPGTWTPQLLRHASDVTAVDASPGKARAASACMTRRPRPSRPASCVKAQRLSGHRRATARTGGKVTRGTPQVRERCKPGVPDSRNSRPILPLWHPISVVAGGTVAAGRVRTGRALNPQCRAPVLDSGSSRGTTAGAKWGPWSDA